MSKLELLGAAAALATVTALGACNQAAPAKPAIDTAAVATAVKADVAQMVTSLNAHDAAKTASHDAADVVAIFHGQPNTVGAAADEATFKQAFADPAFKVAKIDETVDVAASGDMAVYRGTYTNDYTDSKTKKPTTAKVNYIAGYKKQADGSWKIEWYVVSDIGAAPPSSKA